MKGDGSLLAPPSEPDRSPAAPGRRRARAVAPTHSGGRTARRRRASRAAVCLAALWLCGGCAPRAARGDDAAHERERAAATARRIELEWPLAGSGPITNYIQSLGAALGRASGGTERRWRFTVVRDLSTNAFAVGDGRIYVTEGVVTACQNEAEVAAILAHEMGHEIAGHLRPDASRAAASASFGSVMLPLEPAKEKEADRLSLSLLERAGYDPRAALSIASRLASGDDRGAHHFGDAERVAQLRDLLAAAPRGGKLDGEEFRRLKASAAPSR